MSSHMDPNHMTMDTTTPHHHMENMTGMSGMTMPMPMDCNMTMDMGGEMMIMWFHMGYLNQTVLFQGWKIHDVGSLVLSMIGVFLFAMLYEALKFGRQWLVEYAASMQTARFSDMDSKMALTRRAAYVGTSPFTFWHILQTFLHMLQTFISYLLMMVFMTFNGWLCIAVVLGAGVGYFAFGWRARVVVEVADHCH